MLKIRTTLFLLFISCVLFAQNQQDNDTEKLIEHQIGLNATSFIENFFLLSGNGNDGGPYSISYKRIKDRKALRFGLSGRMRISNNSQPGNVQKNTNNSLLVRVGMEWRNEISNRWLYYFGIDIFGRYSNAHNVRNEGLGENDTSNLNYGGGLGPLFGIQFKIRDRIFLTTESSLLYDYGYEKFSQTFENFPELDIVPTESFTHRLDFILPTAIFFVISF